MNKDHEEGEAEAFRPPPKMSDLMGPAAAVAPTNSMPNIPAMQPPVSPVEHRNEPSFAAYPSSPNLAPAPPALSNPPMPAGSGSGGGAADAAAAPHKVPSLQSNMFKMQRNKSEYNFGARVHSPHSPWPQIYFFSPFFRVALKNSYVDVFKSSGAAKTETPILAPSMPTMASTTNFFVPGASAAQPNVRIKHTAKINFRSGAKQKTFIIGSFEQQ